MKKYSKFIVAAAIIGVTLLTYLLYDKWYPSLTFLNPVFWSRNSFVASYCIGLALAIAAFVFGRPGKLAAAWILAGLALSFAFPLVAPLMYGEHQIIPRAAAGYEMQWITKPDNKLGAALKAAQRMHESEWCSYELYGWDADDTLYYATNCQSGYQNYDPASGETQQVSTLPENLKDNPEVVNETVHIGQGIVTGDIQGFDPTTTYPVLAYNRITSPDGQWSAVAFHEYYGPHDVVVLHVRQ